MMEWFVQHYTEEHDRDHHWASPLLAPSLEGLAPAVVGLAGFDPLFDEGRAYAERLQQENVPVTLIKHGDLVHGYIAMAGSLKPARLALGELSRAVSDIINR